MKQTLIVIFFLAFSSSLFSKTNSTELNPSGTLGPDNIRLIELTSYKKDPFAASMYSMIYAGAGQFYAGNYTLGSLLFLGESLYHLFNIGIRYKLQNDYGDSVAFSQMNTSDQILMGAVFFSFMVLKVYSIYDANISVRRYNKDIDEKLKRFKFTYMPGEIRASYSLRL